jgi:hypothetical protein
MRCHYELVWWTKTCMNSMYGVWTMWTCNKIASLTCYVDSIWTCGPICGVFDVCVVICMHICCCRNIYVYLKIWNAGINPKQKKMQHVLCRVYAHGKGHLVIFFVCIHTAKRPRGASLCSLVACCVPSKGFAVWVDGRRTTKIGALPCGWTGDARQRLGRCCAGGGSAHDKNCSTVEAQRTAMIGCTAQGLGARQ